MTYDLVVLGSGPGGYDCALEAAKHGLKVALVEQDFMGGTCLNRGCIPTKFWLGATAVIPELQHQSKLKLASGNVDIDYAAVQSRIKKHLMATRKAMAAQLEKAGITFANGWGRLDDEDDNVLAVSDTETGAVEYLPYKKLVWATGSRPVGLNVPDTVGEGFTILDSDMFLQMEEMPSSLIVVGAGFIGLEMAQIAHRFGAKITVVDFMDRVAPLEDVEVSKTLLSLYKRMKWDVRLGARVAGYKSYKDHAELILDSGETLSADRILEAVGRRPRIEDIENEGVVTIEAGKIKVDDHLMASDTIYAIGDVNGLVPLAHAASHQGAYVAAHAAGKIDTPYDPGPVPSILYGSPEVMRVGKMQEEAYLENHDSCEASTASLIANPMSHVHGATQGFVKVIWSAGKVVGITAVGNDVSRLVTASGLIIQQGWTADDVHSIMFAHPTLDESLLAALKAERQPVK